MERNCGMWINILSHQVKKYFNAKLSEIGITGVQGLVLHHIILHNVKGAVFQKDVENAFSMNRSTATGILQLLEKGGFLRREPMDYDARLKRLIPTEKAACLDAQMEEYLRQMEQCLTQGLSMAQLAQFKKTAAHMSANLGR